MKELTTRDMTEYLKNAMEMESSVYRQKEAICNGEQELRFAAPRINSVQKPYKHTIREPYKSKSVKQWETPAGKIVVIISIPVVLVSIVITILLRSALVALEAFLLLICLIGWSQTRSEVVQYKKEYHDYEKKVQENEKEYEAQMEDYKKAVI